MQGYELTFSGKGLANALYSTPTTKELKLEEVFYPKYLYKGDCQTEGDKPEESQALPCHSEGVRSTTEESHQDKRDTSAFSKPQYDKSINCHSEGVRSTTEESHKLDSNNAEALYRPNATHTRNAIIRGDNLDVLKLLKSAYSEKIKMIYIDPPYNTKNDNFIYPDDFRKDYQAILREVGLLLEDENGEWVESETLRFFRNITGSKSHSGWLAFMLPRLKLARDLLREDGVIFISIDDNEQANLKILCDEIFGEENFVANVIWQKKKGGSQDSQDFAKEHEYILCYQKYEWRINDITQEQNEKDFNKIINGKKAKILKLEKWGNHSLRADRPTLYYSIKDPNGNDFYPIAPNGADGCWRKKPETLDEEHIYWQEDSRGRLTPYEIIYFDEVLDKQKVIKTRTIFTEFGTTTDATKEILNLFNNQKVFDTPKPLKLIKQFLRLSTSSNNTAQEGNYVAGGGGYKFVAESPDPELILDFFAGSGTIAQAVMELNAEDGGNRQFILVQLDEPIKEDKSKTAYDFCKNELGSANPTISDITIERVKRAAAKIAKEHRDFQGDLGFSVYSLCEKPSLVCDKSGHLELFSGREGVTPSDIARNLSLQCGKSLDRELECIVESKLYKCDDAYCVVECDKEVLEILRNTKNEYILIDGYASLELEEFLNLKNSANINERLRIVY
ncbi:type III restriction endonuclease subunit M [Helicobacter aurati]|uniref:site-specific DNA-methyltransferase (adenine-specific) n=3 Tax=Helicobacter aurati TaxID=137778 RepID=A0A3D8J4R7_9HELI|nr:type III restriction endonuclease subunit M [Helicobacter aurati]